MILRHPTSAGTRKEFVRPTALEVAASDVLLRIRSEYREMPGLCLTLLQARRLWALDESTCSRLLSNLVSEGFLRKTAGGYVKA